MKTLTSLLAIGLIVGLAGFGQAAVVDNFDSYADQSILNGQGGWSSSGGNEGHQTSALRVVAGKGVGGSNAVTSAKDGTHATEGSSAMEIPVGIRGDFTAQVDINVGGDGQTGDVEFRIATMAFANFEDTNSHNNDWVGPRMRSGVPSSFGGVSWAKTHTGTFSLFSPAHDSSNLDLANQGYIQAKIVVADNAVGAYYRDIDDATGLPLGDGTWHGSMTGGTRFWHGGLGIEAVQLLAQGGDSDKSYYDNLIITPEPASLALLGLGGLMMLRRRHA